MSIPEFKFKTSFAKIHIKPVIAADRDKYLAVASLEQIKKFIPEVDIEKNYDLLPVAFNACVINRVNANGDVLDTKTALATYKNFINKPINLEHKRDSIIGVITTVSFSAFGSDKPLTEEEVKDTEEPFNIVLGGLIWRIANSALAQAIEDAADPSSSKYQSISASWEMGFTDYHLIQIKGEEKNIKGATVVSDVKEIELLTPKLAANEGLGKVDNETFLYRKPVGAVLPLGVGLTEAPAADVKGVAVATKKEKEDEGQAIAELIKKTVLEVITSAKLPGGLLDNSSINLKNSSQQPDTSVKENSIFMKINSIADITDDKLKEMKASVIADFIGEEIKKADEKYIKDRADKESALKTAQETITSTANELKKVQEELVKIKSEISAKDKQDKFSQRMSALDTEFELDADERKTIADDIKEFDDEAFAAYSKKLNVFMKNKKKGKKGAAAEPDADDAAKTAKAAAAAAVETALANATQTTPTVPSTTAKEPTLLEKYKNAFTFENVVVTK